MADTPGEDFYAPLPTSIPLEKVNLGEGGELADRGARFIARFLDNLVVIGVVMPFACLAGAFSDPDVVEQEWFLAMILIPAVLVYIYQCYLITTEGQTIGKRWVGIRIVNEHGLPPGFMKGVLAREWLLVFVGALCQGFLGLLDSLFIFREDRRCLHDHAAGTRVVKV